MSQISVKSIKYSQYSHQILTNIHIKYSIVGLCKSFCLFQLSYVALVKHLETPQRQGPSGDDGGTDLFVQKMRGD